VVVYRQFCNSDSPALAAVWNESFTGRGAVCLKHCSPFENYVFAKPYFDPAGLIVASVDDEIVGFAHAGFAPNRGRTAVDPSIGILCLLGVRPSHRRQGIGSELLARSERYLQDRGAKELRAGPLPPENPFYFGLYGGSNNAGFLDSDPAAEHFFRKHGYEIRATSIVCQRPLSVTLPSADVRFGALRKQFEIQMVAAGHGRDWWDECVYGPIELVDFQMQEKSTGVIPASVSAWEMEGFSVRWNQPSVGVVNLQVEESWRRRGLAKFLLSQVLRHLQEQFFGLIEAQTPAGSEAGLGLLRSLGFEQVDTGKQYTKQA
jgi:ribosomal protein S18 acetylase RimI-like enzyme